MAVPHRAETKPARQLGNRILAALPDTEYEPLSPALKRVCRRRGEGDRPIEAGLSA
jgi:hypothetical protein